MASLPEPPSAELDLERLAEIAISSMARVDLCRVTSGSHRGTLVAVKRLHDDVADDPEFVRMFRDEVWMTSALLHENVVRVIGWGQDVEGPYFATEFVRGVSVARLLRTVFHTGEMFTERHIVYLASCVCKGLQAAHSLRAASGELLNLVHRDLTPDNVLVSFDGEVKITDFGLAKAKRRSAMTMVGMVKGTCEYMAPEQVLGKPIDGRVDIFALGVMLYELFCGKRPFQGRHARDVMQAIVEVPAPNLADLRPGIHSVLVEIVHHCLAKDPAERYQTAFDLDQQLSQWLQGHGYHDNQEHLARFVRRNAMRQMRWCDRAIAGEFAEGASVGPPTASPWGDEARSGSDTAADGDAGDETETRVEIPQPGSAAEAPALSESAVVGPPGVRATPRPAAGVPAAAPPAGAPPAAAAPDTERDLQPSAAASEEAPTIIQKPGQPLPVVPAAVAPPPDSSAPVDSSVTLPSAREPAGAPAAAPAPVLRPAPTAEGATGGAPAGGRAAAPPAPKARPEPSRRSRKARPAQEASAAPATPAVPGEPGPARSSVAPPARTAPGPRGAAVQQKARATIKEATRLAAQADRAAGLARRAAERAREAASQAAEAAARAEAAATAAGLAQKALELVKAGEPEAAQEQVDKAEQIRRDSLPPPAAAGGDD